MSYETIDVRFQDSVCHLQLNRPEANNTINARLVTECTAVLDVCEESANVVVVSGSPEVFCFGADFQALAHGGNGLGQQADPGALYDLWLRLATGPYVTVAHVRGKANAGGVGFVAASDIVVADEGAQFSLSELLFGLYPACVMPFLVRRVGFQKAHYMTLTTQPVAARQAAEWGLVDTVDAQSELAVRRHLLRLRRLSKPAIRRYKKYMSRMSVPLPDLRAAAVAGNVEIFSDRANLAAITRYVDQGLFPWESADAR